MILCSKKLVWLVAIYFQFNLSFIQVKGGRNPLNGGSMSQNLTKIDHNFEVVGIKNFLFYKSNVIYERSCMCEMEVSCSCCESVVLLFTKSLGKLCGNLMYRPDGLNINITLDGNTIRSMTVTNYRPLKICALIPKSLFSIICLNILELNLFPRSITACPRLEIATKNQNWKINYTCVSISTMGSEIDALVIKNPNRLTNVGVINLPNIPGNQTVPMQNVSPPKQTQSQLSAITPEVINLPSLNMSTTGMTSRTPGALSTPSMITQMQPSNPLRPPPMPPSTSVLSSTATPSSTPNTPISTRNLPLTATTKLTSKKSSVSAKTQTSFRNFPITATTSITPENASVSSSTFLSSKKSTIISKNTIPISSRNLPITATTSINFRNSLVNFSTPITSDYSSPTTISTLDSSENTTAAGSTSVNSQNISITSTVPMNTQKLLETFNKTLSPIISTVSTIFTDTNSSISSEQLDINETTNSPANTEPSSSSTKAMTDQTFGTTIKIIPVTKMAIMNTTSQHSNQTVEMIASDLFIKFPENITVI